RPQSRDQRPARRGGYAVSQPLRRYADRDLRTRLDRGDACQRRVRVHRRLPDRDQGRGTEHLRLVRRRWSVRHVDAEGKRWRGVINTPESAEPPSPGETMQARPTIAVIGGTGDLGSALAKRWAAAGYPIVLGSRFKEKAQAAAQAMNASAVTGEDNRGAAAAADIVVVAVPYASHEAILNEIKPVVAGKIVVDAVVPLVPPKVSVVNLPPARS